MFALQIRRSRPKNITTIIATMKSSRVGLIIDRGMNTTNNSIDKCTVQELRNKYFLNCVSVSYASSGNDSGLMIMQGKGSKLIDETGASYLDTRNNVCHVGHCHSAVVDAVSQQLATLNTNTRYLHPNVCKLAKRLVSKCPKPLEKVIFVNSGSEANDLALRLARAYTSSKNTIVIDGGYHGHTLSALEVSPYKYEHSKEFDLTPQGYVDNEGEKLAYKTPGRHIWKIPCPDTYRGRHRGDKSDVGKRYAKYVQSACDYFNSLGESAGAFIMEGGMSVGGVIFPPNDFIRDSVKMVREAGGIFIADEVQTGFGRLGSSFWAFEQGDHGVVPDIMTVGKPFGNGMSLGAVIMTRTIADHFDSMDVEYFNTFGGSPVAAAAGLAVLDVLEEEKLQQHALVLGDYMINSFRKIQKETRMQDKFLIGDIRGCGLFLGIELVRDKLTKEPAPTETSFLCTILKHQFHVLTSIDGLNKNVLVVKPPMVFSKEDADYFVSSFVKASEQVNALTLNELYSTPNTPT